MFIKILLSTVINFTWVSYCSFLSNSSCSPQCTCSSDLKFVSCLNQNFSKIPNVHPSVETLVLRKNSIKILPDNVFEKCSKLISIEITDSGLQDLQNQSLSGLYQLEKLNFQSNKISILSPEVFQDLRSLKTLILATNNFYNIPEAITRLNNLQELNLSVNKISAIEFPSGIAKLIYLSSLKFSYNPLITLDGLQAVSSTVKVLHLSNCQMKNVPQGIFQNFKRLQTLKLSSNPLTNISIHNILSDLHKSTTIQTLNLNKIGLLKEHLNVFRSFTNTLINLFICCNNLEKINTNIFASLTNLQSLDISDNNITDNYILNYLEHLKLRNLYISHNKFTHLPDSLPETLIYLDISSNLINKFYNNLNHLKLLKHLDLSFNNISITDSRIFSSLINLETLDLCCNMIQNIPEGGFLLFANMSNMKSLNLSNNNLFHLSLDIFNGLTNLKELYLGRNNLNHIIVNDVSGKLFQTLTSLSILDIRNNKLDQIFSKTFNMLINLKKLFLQGNLFKELPEDIFKNHKMLESLDLSDNCLKTVSPILPLSSHLKWLNLQNNCFSCNCELLSFRELINNENLLVVNLSSYICFSPHEWEKREITTFLNKSSSCSHSRNVTIIIGSFVGAAFVILLITIFIGKLCHCRKNYSSLSSLESILTFKSSSQQILPLTTKNSIPDLIKLD